MKGTTGFPVCRQATLYILYIRPGKLTWNLKKTLGKGDTSTKNQFLGSLVVFRSVYNIYYIFVPLKRNNQLFKVNRSRGVGTVGTVKVKAGC